MRQALFAVVLVAASFAGGAVVNGPGLRWAQVWAMGRLGLVQEADGAGPVAGPHADDEGDLAPLDVQPASADRSMVASTGPETPRPTSTTGPTVGRSAATPDPLEPLAPLPLTDRSAEAAPSSPSPASASPSASPIAPVAPTPLPDPEASPVAVADAGAGALDTPTPPPAQGRGDASVALASLARPARQGSAGPPAPGAASGTSASTSTSASADPSDWPEVRRALRALGVSRYGTDGEPGGRVRFHCVIPLAGRHAVGQQFEAEADDELQAARAALRRITLWRASDSGPP